MDAVTKDKCQRLAACSVLESGYYRSVDLKIKLRMGDINPGASPGEGGQLHVQDLVDAYETGNVPVPDPSQQLEQDPDWPEAEFGENIYRPKTKQMLKVGLHKIKGEKCTILLGLFLTFCLQYTV